MKGLDVNNFAYLANDSTGNTWVSLEGGRARLKSIEMRSYVQSEVP